MTDRYERGLQSPERLARIRAERSGNGRGNITALIGPPRRPPAGFSSAFQAFRLGWIVTYGDRRRAKSFWHGRKVALVRRQAGL